MQMTSGNFACTLATGAVAGAVLAIAISFAFPRMYRSQATIAVTNAQQPYAIDRILALAQQVLSRKSLGSIIQEKGLYPAESARMPVDDVINLMRRNIEIRSIPDSLNPPQAPAEIVVEFRYPNPVVAQKVTIALLSNFIEFNLRQALTNSSNDPSLFAGQRLQVNGRATLPLNPIGPNRIWIATFGLLAGLLTAVTLSFVTRRRSATA